MGSSQTITLDKADSMLSLIHPIQAVPEHVADTWKSFVRGDVDNVTINRVQSRSHCSQLLATSLCKKPNESAVTTYICLPIELGPRLLIGIDNIALDAKSDLVDMGSLFDGFVNIIMAPLPSCGRFYIPDQRSFDAENITSELNRFNRFNETAYDPNHLQHPDTKYRAALPGLSNEGPTMFRHVQKNKYDVVIERHHMFSSVSPEMLQLALPIESVDVKQIASEDEMMTWKPSQELVDVPSVACDSEEVWPPYCEANGEGLSHGSAGNHMNFIIILRSKDAKPCTTSKVKLRLWFDYTDEQVSHNREKPDWEVVQTGSAFYVSYRSQKCGQLKLNVFINGIHISGSPFIVQIHAMEIDRHASTIMTDIYKKTAATVSVHPFDLALCYYTSKNELPTSSDQLLQFSNELNKKWSNDSNVQFVSINRLELDLRDSFNNAVSNYNYEIGVMATGFLKDLKVDVCVKKPCFEYIVVIPYRALMEGGVLPPDWPHRFPNAADAAEEVFEKVQSHCNSVFADFSQSYRLFVNENLDIGKLTVTCKDGEIGEVQPTIANLADITRMYKILLQEMKSTRRINETANEESLTKIPDRAPDLLNRMNELMKSVALDAKRSPTDGITFKHWGDVLQTREDLKQLINDNDRKITIHDEINHQK
eukprot:GHVH01002190.1.p1 GENE.GHVH01002190.1~~GHVH01002190.1.p1  ORF type:complete len:651 (+),score=94.16 GHVH01002190.1:1415-3367(+)